MPVEPLRSAAWWRWDPDIPPGKSLQEGTGKGLQAPPPSLHVVSVVGDPVGDRSWRSWLPACGEMLGTGGKELLSLPKICRGTSITSLACDHSLLAGTRLMIITLGEDQPRTGLATAFHNVCCMSDLDSETCPLLSLHVRDTEVGMHSLHPGWT